MAAHRRPNFPRVRFSVYPAGMITPDSLWARYKRYLFYRPDSMSDQEFRLFVMGRAGYPAGLVVHFIFVVIFWRLEVWPLF